MVDKNVSFLVTQRTEKVSWYFFYNNFQLDITNCCRPWR